MSLARFLICIYPPFIVFLRKMPSPDSLLVVIAIIILNLWSSKYDKSSLFLFFVSPKYSVHENTQPVKVSQGSTYSELLSVIEEMSREIRPTYAGSKSAMERLKRGIFFLKTLGFFMYVGH